MMTSLKKLFFWHEEIIFLKSTLPLPFRLDDRRPPTLVSFDIHLSNLNAWVAKLPLAHTGKTAESLYALLNEMNALDLSATDRFLALECLYSLLDHLDHAISKRYIGASFPLTEKNNQLASLAREFQEAMAIGYKIIISDQLTRKDCKIPATVFSAALHRSMLYLSQVLLKSYEIYAPVNTFLWKEMHWIYRFSEQHGLHHQLNPPPPLQSQNTTNDSIPATLSGVYKQALLLALSGPYGLHQSEINKIHRIVGQWQTKCSLLRFKENENVFVVDLESDDIPVPYRAERHNDLSGDRFRWFNISNLDAILDASVKNSQPAKDCEFSANTLRRLALGWKTSSQRVFERQEVTGNSYDKIVIGLDAIHDILQEGREEAHNLLATIIPPIPTKDSSKNNNQEYAVTFFSKEVIPVGTTLVDAWDVIHINMEDSNSRTTFTHESVPIVPQNCSILDRSFGGVRILWSPPESYNHGFYTAQVGQLVALRTILTSLNANENPSWVVGVVRWMKCKSPNQIEFGIQIIAPYVIPIFIQSIKCVSKEKPKRGLLIPKDPTSQTTTLIVPSLLDHPGEILILSDGAGITRRIEINQRLESSFEFSTFDFTLLEDLPQQPKKPEHSAYSKPQEKENKFSSLWAKL